MRWLLVIALVAAPAAARTVARTGKSEVVGGLQLELGVYDANDGRGPIKARFSFANRGNEPIKARLDRALVAFDITECGATRTLALAKSGGVATIGVGHTVTNGVNLGALANQAGTALHAGVVTVVARYEVDEPGLWRGKLVTAPVELVVKTGAKCPTRS